MAAPGSARARSARAGSAALNRRNTMGGLRLLLALRLLPLHNATSRLTATTLKTMCARIARHVY